jgi:Trk K+ transport system NAD-binding subunit
VLIFLFFRRMRAPLLVLVGAYAISITGLVLIPGEDDQGNIWYFDFFHAFYFVSYMGSTIGFGEIPYPFNAAQRLWTTLMIYLCVISWLYAIGKILTLIQDPAFQRVVTEQRFTRRVKHLTVPFYLVCGYGETGSLLVQALARRNLQSVVIDAASERINQLTLDSLSFDIPALCGDARDIGHLREGGLLHPNCRAVIALTHNEEANVKIAITSKLLRPKLPVICRTQTQDTAANLASFNTDHIINPFKVFAVRLAMVLRTPHIDLLHRLLVELPGTPLPRQNPPPHGTWIICGFGRFGSMVHHYLTNEDIPTTVIEPNPEQGAPEGTVSGRGTEAGTLRRAGIDKAAGIIAGADQDTNNLSIIMTAKELNPNLYTVARQNQRANDPIFQAASLDMVMDSGAIFVQRILPLLTTPMLSRFLQLTRGRSEKWAENLTADIFAFCDAKIPLIWPVKLDAEQAPAAYNILIRNQPLYLGHLLRDPLNPEQTLPGMVLLLQRGNEEKLLPSAEETLQPNDQLLFCGHHDAGYRFDLIVTNPKVLECIITGEKARPDGYVWRWLRQYSQRSTPPASVEQDVSK